MAVPNSALCYICLDEGPDEAGKPLVRDCSCRGNTAGFAHQSCIMEYAKQKSKQAADSDLWAFSTPWDDCNNCNQPFQNQVALDLSSGFISFAEEAYGYPGTDKWDKVKVMAALRSKIESLFKVVYCYENKLLWYLHTVLTYQSHVTPIVTHHGYL